MLILGIETSCDDTSVALLEHRSGNELEIRANLIASQIEAHQLFGGVVPEIASRAHLEILNPLLDALWRETGASPRDLDLIGVTSGPGLAGALLVGVAAGKALGYALKKPVRAVNHVEGHLVSAWLESPDLKLPMLSLVVSGGHTDLIWCAISGVSSDWAAPATMRWARLSIKSRAPSVSGFPAAPTWNVRREMATRGAFNSGVPTWNRRSISPIRVLKPRRRRHLKPSHASKRHRGVFQFAAIGQLKKQVTRAIEQFSPATLGVCGGVAANGALRAELAAICGEKGVDFSVPAPILCTDNAAMIAAAAFFRARAEGFPGFELESLGFEARSVWAVGS